MNDLHKEACAELGWLGSNFVVWKSCLFLLGLALAISAVPSAAFALVNAPISISSSANPGEVGTPVTITVTVSGIGLPIIVPTGTVVFKDNGISIGSGTLDSTGHAALTTSSLGVGIHPITVRYNGDLIYNSGTSSVLNQSLTQGATITTIVPSPNPSQFSSNVTFTATVSGAPSSLTPTGTVTFKDGASTIGSGTLNGSGQATFSTSSLSGGSHSITAAYGGDSNFSSSTSATLTQTVNPTSSSASVTASSNPSTLGTPVTFTATVTGSGGTPTGTVTFKDGASTIGSGSLNGSGQATLTTASEAVGSHMITVVYAGDSNFAAATSSPLTFSVNQATSSTSVTSSANPSAAGNPVTFSATVTGAGATGTVTFKDGASTIGTGSLNGSGVATFTTSALTLGGHSITAVYGGDGNFTTSTSPTLTQTVNANMSTTTLGSSANPSAFGTAVIFTATVTGAGATPTGTVTFKDGASTIGSGTLNGSGQATVTTSTLTAGSHSISAVFSGDTAYATSAAPTMTQKVGENATATTLTASPNPVAAGASATLTAMVSGVGGTPTGTVTFKDGTATLSTVTLNVSGRAILTVNAFTGGTHSLSAIYSGDSNFLASSSSAVALVANQNASTTSLTATPNPAPLGAAVSLTATITASGGTPTGNVTFKDGAATLGTVALNGSALARLTISTLGSGNHPITAIYGGDVNFSVSTSPTIGETIQQRTATVALSSSLNPSVAGQAVTFTVSVTSSYGVPTGTASFRDGASVIGTATLGGGAAALTTSSLVSGTHTISATYSGDANYVATTSAALTQSVSLPADSLKLRALQLAATRIAAQDSGDAIARAIDSAVSEGFADDGEMFIPSGSGIRLNLAGESGRRSETFPNVDRRPRWLLWTDLRYSGLNVGRPSQDMTGDQWNGLAGITFRATPDFVVGMLGGYEYFDYASQPLDGHLRGAGWTAGTYFGWRLIAGLRFQAGLTYSGLDFNGVAGTASGSFPVSRMLATAGLTGTYKITQDLEFEPSMQAFGLLEKEQFYIDSLGTAQSARTFSAGRASLGAKWLYRSQWGDFMAVPYLGLFGDYYFTKDDADSGPHPLSSLDGASLRALFGMTLATKTGAQFSVGGELGGIGSGSFSIWSGRARAAVPF